MYKCNISSKCGSCKLLNKEYKETLKYKLESINQEFKKNGLKIDVKEIKESPKEIAYRNKMIVGFKYQDKNLVSGFYEEESHKIVSLDHCIMHSDIQNKILKETTKIFKDLKVRAYDEDKRIGLIRYMIIREATFSKEIMIILVLASDIFPNRNEVVKRIKNIDSNIKTIVQNINSRKTSIVLGDNYRVLYGKGYIHDLLLNNKFKLMPSSFFQINSLQAENLYKEVIDVADFNKDEVVIDAYSGLSTIAISVAPFVKKVISIENNKEAVLSAKENIKDNNIKNIIAIKDDATNYMNLIATKNERIDAVILDPPRSGTTLEFIEAVAKLKTKKVVYVSCGKESLARDLKQFLKLGYIVKSIKCFDMFCFTEHIETVVLLVSKTYQARD